MSRAAWAEETGDLETVVALSLPATRAAVGPVALALRASLYGAVRDLFADPRCTPTTRQLVREYLTGRRPDAEGVPS